MISVNQITFLALFGLAVYVSGQVSPSTTCSNSNLLMTPTLRQNVLNVLNEARNKVENGQLLLYNGKYALQAASLPPLEWSCEMEEQLLEASEEGCAEFPTSSSLYAMNITWTFNRFDDSDVESLVADMLANQVILNGQNHMELSRHNLYLQPFTTYGFNQIYALSDKALNVACAIHNCNTSAAGPFYGEIQSSVVCKVSLSEELAFGDEIYQVSSSANYIPPTQDVICSGGSLSVEQREAVLFKINEVRSQISQGSYPVGNGNTALQPSQPLSPLSWNCQDEIAMRVEKMFSSFDCSTGEYFDAATEFQTIVNPSSIDYSTPSDYVLTHLSEFATEFFVHNSNFYFLSQSPAYSSQYPAAFALSSQAESVACYQHICFMPIFDFHFICRVKPVVQINDNLYQL